MILDSAAADILRRRAREIAQRELETENRGIHGHLIVVRREDALYGFPIEAVEEVRRIQLTHLPGATGAIQGLFHLRGEILSLIDLSSFATSVARPEHGDSLLALVLSAGGKMIGIRIDEAIGSRVVYRDELNPGAGGGTNGLVSALTRDVVEIIDCNALFNHPDIYMGA
jgi:chemotaxis signal transduction protein